MGQRRFAETFRDEVAAWLDGKDAQDSPARPWLAVGPDVFDVVLRLTLAPDVRAGDKARLGAAVVYFVSPMDLVPEEEDGALGYLDDIALALHVLRSVASSVGIDVVRRYWTGSEDVEALLARAPDAFRTLLSASVAAQVEQAAADPAVLIGLLQGAGASTA